MRQLPEPEAVIIAIVDDDPSVQRGLQRLIGLVGWKPETLSIFRTRRRLAGHGDDLHARDQRGRKAYCGATWKLGNAVWGILDASWTSNGAVTSTKSRPCSQMPRGRELPAFLIDRPRFMIPRSESEEQAGGEGGIQSR
jgi:hypothetical protein